MQSKLPGRRAIAAAAFLPLLSLALAAQQTPTVTLAPPPVLAAFDVTAATLQGLTVPGTLAPNMTVSVVLAGQVLQLDLWPHDVRAPGYQLWTRDQGGLSAVVPSPATTCRGTIVGEPDSEVAASIEGGGMKAWLRRATGDVWVVQPLLGVVPGAGAAAHIVYRALDNAPLPGHCGTFAPGTGPQVPGNLDFNYVCQLALEADYPLFVARGSSVTATQNDVLGVVNAMDLIYRNNVLVQLQVSQLIIDSAPDPYTTNDANTLLGQFQGYWNANYGAVARDVAHLFSGRPIGAVSGGTIGLAYVGVICNLPNAYGLSQTTWTTNFAYRVGVSAHEIGHNFAATHCDGVAGCAIMCSVAGGCSNNVGSFSATERAQISTHAQGAGCLQVIATTPVLTGAAPTQLATVNPGLLTLTGTGLLGTTVVTVGGTPLTNGLQVVSDTQVRLVPPAGLSLGPKLVSVTNPAGTSNSLLVVYNGANPAQLLVPSAVIGGNTLTWTMGGWQNDPAYLGISFINTTSPFYGQNLLDGFIPLWIGTLDARGMAVFTVPVPAGLLGGITVFSQLVDENAGTLRSVSNVRSTLVIN